MGRDRVAVLAACLAAVLLAWPRPACGAAAPRPRYLVVTSRAGLPLLEPLLDHRRQHYDVLTLTVEELARGGQPLTPPLVKRAVRARQTPEAPLDCLLLAADTRSSPAGLPAVPTHPEGFDAWYGVLGTDDLAAGPPARHQPAIAVGRFPAATAAELEAMVAKTLAYERRSRPGPWQRRIHVVAGTASFGAAADALVDRAVRVVLDRAIPLPYSVTVTRGLTSSPYCYPPEEFERRVIELFGEGALFVTYLGHGKAREAYRVQGFASGTMMDCGTMRRLRCPSARCPVAVFIACSMGRFDGRADGVAEAALKSPGGPVACVGSPRRNHVYGNAVFGLELARALFGGEEPTLGGCLRLAQRRLVCPQGQGDLIRLTLEALALADPEGRVPRAKHASLLTRHVYLYGLLGDPALRLARPALRIHPLRAALAQDRSHWLVEGTVQGMARGTVLVSLEVPRAAIRARLEPVSPDDPAWRTAMKRNYAAANAKVVTQAQVTLGGGRFRAVLPAPQDPQPRAYIIKAIAWSDRRCALGAAPVTWPPADAPEEGSTP